MKWLWLGWLVCVFTAGLLGYMALVETPAISAMLGGLALPDAKPLGYDADGARALFDAFAADHAAAQVIGRQSASEAYLAMHASFDLLLPPLLAASLGFCGLAALFQRRPPAEIPRMAGVGLGLVLALAFTYLACDFLENAVADAIFGPKALALAYNEQLVFVLQVLTRGKYVTLGLAGGLIIALWIWRWKSARQTVQR